MITFSNGQCGTCAHFGNDIPEAKLVQIRVSQESSDEVVGGCDHPSNSNLHLRVAVVGSCDGYSPANAA